MNNYDGKTETIKGPSGSIVKAPSIKSVRDEDPRSIEDYSPINDDTMSLVASVIDLNKCSRTKCTSK